MQEFQFPDEKEEVKSQEIELELETDEKVEVEVVDDTPPEDRNRKPLEKEVQEPTEDELEEYSTKVQKRLKELTHARHDERRRADALAREKAELERIAQAIAEENKRLKQYVDIGQNAYIDKSKSLAEMSFNNAKAKLKAALETGDTDATVAAQEELLKAQFEMQQAASFKPVELQQEKQPVYTKTEQPKSPDLDDKVVSWAEKNPWFEKPGKEDMTGYAYGVHNKLVRQYGEGFTKTDEYYQEIDKAMRRAFPEEFEDFSEKETKPAPSRTKSVVAPAQRTSAPKKIRLTTTQQNVAKKLGIPLELYAKKMAELENQNG